jgi:spermidine/putrescine transport system substrate-binding protein
VGFELIAFTKRSARTFMDQEPIKILAPRPGRDGDVTRRRALGIGVGGLASLYLAACGGSSAPKAKTGASGALSADAKVESGPLLMANWADYTDPNTYKAYTSKYGPKVSVDGFGSNDELIAKLSAGGADYDIVVPSGSYVPVIADKGLARELDHSLIPNLKNLPQKFTEQEFDPANKYSVTKDYGVTSFYYRADAVPNPPDTLLGWFELLPKMKGKNINFIEGAGETIPLALLALGLKATSENEDDYKKALELMLAAKPAIKTINSTYIERLSRGQIDIGLGWNGDIARGAEAAAKKNIEVKMFVPQDRGWYWTDNWLIPSASKNPVAAHKWIDYMLDPTVAGKEWDYVGYPIPVNGAEKYADPKVAKNPITSIPQAILSQYSTGLQTPALAKLQSTYYTRFRAA